MPTIESPPHPPSRALPPLLCVSLAAAVTLATPAHAQEVVDLPADDRPLESPTPLWEVGGPAAPEWAAFTSLTGAAFDPAGRLYLLDPSTPRVVLVDGRGEHVRDVGRSGEGPGEYRRPGGISTTPSGSVLVWDGAHRAWLRWDSAGETLDVGSPSFERGRPGRTFEAVDEGSVVTTPALFIADGHYRYFTSDGMRDADGELPVFRIPLADGAEPLELHTLRLPEWTGSGDPPQFRAFEVDPSWGTLEGYRLAVHDTPEYAVRVVGPGGRVERLLRRPLEPRAVTRAMKEMRRERRREMVREGRVIGVAAVGAEGRPIPPRWEEMIRNMHFAERVPVIREIATDGRGRIWVERWPASGDPDEPGPVDVLTADGRYLGSWPADGPGIPDAFGPDGLAAWLVEGELDVPVARVMRLPPSLR